MRRFQIVFFIGQFEMDFEEERVTRKYGTEIFSFPPRVWADIAANVRSEVMRWVRSKRSEIDDDDYWELLRRGERALDELGF